MKSINLAKSELFEMCYELEDIISCEDAGYNNTYDIMVDKTSTFILGNGTVTHNSARGGLTPVIGRKEVGYYTLKGKPLNAWSSPQSKFTANKELSELYQIIQNTDYEYIVFATDQDLDGMHIRGLLLGFVMKYLPEYLDKLGMLQTPVMTVTKNKKLISWYYGLGSDVKLKSGEVVSYKKGLGSWKEDELKEIISKDGLDKMINILEIDSDQIVDDWLGDDSDIRKEYIQANTFSIAKL